MGIESIYVYNRFMLISRPHYRVETGITLQNLNKVFYRTFLSSALLNCTEHMFKPRYFAYRIQLKL